MKKKRVKRQKMKDVLLFVLMLAAAAWFFFGCSPCERLARRCPPVEYVRDSIAVHDTLVRETVITDTLIEVKLIKETERVYAYIADTARAETDYAVAEAYVAGDNISLSLTNKDSAEVLVQRIQTLEMRLRNAYHGKETGKVQTVYKTRGIVKVAAWIGLASVILTIIYLIAIIIKKK